MSITVMARVWAETTCKGSRLVILLALADWCNDRGECDPSYTKLAAKARVDRRRAIRLVKELAGASELEIKSGGGFSYGPDAVSNAIVLTRYVGDPSGAGATTPSGAGTTTPVAPAPPPPVVPAPPALVAPAPPHYGQQLPSTTTTNNNTPSSVAAPPPSEPAPAGTRGGRGRTGKSPAQRPAKPCFDAFRAIYPGTAASLPGAFDTACRDNGLTPDDWRDFLADPKQSAALEAGMLPAHKVTSVFLAWARNRRRGSNSAGKIAPIGAPENWRDVIFAADGSRRAPQFALRRLGMDEHAPRDQWPAWVKEALA